MRNILVIAILLSVCLFSAMPKNEISFTLPIVSTDNKFTGGPYPNMTELIALKEQGITTIVSLLDPSFFSIEPLLITKENHAVATLGMNLIHIQNLDAEQIQTLVKSTAHEKYYVHGYHDQDRVFKFMNIVNQITDSALPLSLFTGTPMQSGIVKIIAPNVAIGPRPIETEFKEYLKARGINNIGYTGPCDSQESITDKHIAELAHLNWMCLQVNDTIKFNALRNGGPWYVYGPVLPLIEVELTKRISQLTSATSQ